MKDALFEPSDRLVPKDRKDHLVLVHVGFKVRYDAVYVCNTVVPSVIAPVEFLEPIGKVVKYLKLPKSASNCRRHAR